MAWASAYAGSSGRLVSRLRAGAIAAIERVQGWRERARQRRVLAALDERMLRDLGLSSGMARHESAKPFWRA